MKCPRCGSEMVLDEHRKYPLNMCYDCGYMEGRNFGDDSSAGESNFTKLKSLSFNETVAFLVKGLGVTESAVTDFLEEKAQ